MPAETGVVRGEDVWVSHVLLGILTNSQGPAILMIFNLRGLHAKVGNPPVRENEVNYRGRN